MPAAQKLGLAVLIHAVFISSSYASEQSEAKGFTEGAQAELLFRNGYISRDKKNGAADTSSWAQTVIANIDSGYTQGNIGFGVGAVGDFSFKLGDNAHAGDNMIAKRDDGTPYDQWTRGGGNVKARVSNTTVRYGTQVLDLPVLASNTARLVPEYFTGTLIQSREIKGLELTAGKFTKNQFSDQIATDQKHLDRAVVWGAKYQPNAQFKTAYYGLDSQDIMKRHYLNVNYKQLFDANHSLTYDVSGYRTTFEPTAFTYSALGDASTEKTNHIWALSGTYNTGPHTLMLAYQQNSGDVGYDYGQNADGGQSVYLPNSYLSDFIGNGEKSAQIQYSLDFGAFDWSGLNWTTALVYGWDIRATDNQNHLVDDNATEREFFNQVSYKVQTGFAKDSRIRIRHSYYRASEAYDASYIRSTDEWRIFLDIPVKLF